MFERFEDGDLLFFKKYMLPNEHLLKGVAHIIIYDELWGNNIDVDNIVLAFNCIDQICS